MEKKRNWFVVGTVLFLALGHARGAEADQKEIEEGRRVYDRQRCATCHSIENQGNRRYPLDGVGGRLTRDDVRRWIVAPQEMRKGIAKRSYKLPESDLGALVDYLMSLKE
jgi:mono/diheme cytochrome c family protein